MLSPVSIAGRLQQFLRVWKTICEDPVVLAWLKGYKIPFHSRPKQLYEPADKEFSATEKREISKLLDEFLNKGIIKETAQAKDQFISRIFITPKNDGSFRLIINLKELNEFVITEHFKLEDQKTVVKLLSKDCFLATIDLKDAYYLIPMFETHKKYLRFKFENKIFEFQCLPMGLCTAPFVYTKLMKPVISYLRERGFTSVLYLDDFLLMGNSKEECLLNVKTTLEFLEKLGLIINYNKSILVPSKRIKYLGMIYDSKRMIVTIPGEKKDAIVKWASDLKRNNYCKIRDLAKFLGTIVSVCSATKYGYAYTKRMEREKWLALERSRGNYESYLEITRELCEDLA